MLHLETTVEIKIIIPIDSNHIHVYNHVSKTKYYTEVLKEKLSLGNTSC